MKARRIIWGTWICASIFCACGGGQKQSTNNEGSKKELERIENFSVDVFRSPKQPKTTRNNQT